MKVILSDIASIKAGHPFRGSISENKLGNALTIQIKDLRSDGTICLSQLLRTQLEGRRTPDWLQKGDILFSARGPRNIAACLGEINNPMVCAPHYYLIQIIAKQVLPEFVAWQLNQLPCQRYFSQSAEGSAQLSIRRAILDRSPLVIPSIQKQRTIVALSNKAQQEKVVLKALIENRKKQLDSIAQQLLAMY